MHPTKVTKLLSEKPHHHRYHYYSCVVGLTGLAIQGAIRRKGHRQWILEEKAVAIQLIQQIIQHEENDQRLFCKVIEIA